MIDDPVGTGLDELGDGSGEEKLGLAVASGGVFEADAYGAGSFRRADVQKPPCSSESFSISTGTSVQNLVGVAPEISREIPVSMGATAAGKSLNAGRPAMERA